MFDSCDVSLAMPLSVPAGLGVAPELDCLRVPVCSRQQAIRNGWLIDVTPLAVAFGFRDAVALTHLAFTQIVATAVVSDNDPEIEATLTAVLFAAASALRAQSYRRLREVTFTVVLPCCSTDGPDRRTAEFSILAGPGDHGETVLTLCSLNED